ncbi:hypothetical protein D7V64_10955 [Acinetobacter cumulans]|uniref:Carboxypeptidase regulatory-like domain-containing protein n=2 Tax=Acinetobacter cumulans TaxID=2136182 RepID=A0A3A8G9S6_9GAMM|nr:hypothetical protein D7V64_10955 [Acinetobacter cumulans]
MMKHKTLKLSVLSIALTSLLTACGGGGGSDGGSTTPPANVQGRAIDGPLSGATVTFNDCNNAQTTTDASGNFTFPTGCSKSLVTITGGIDTATDLPFTGELKAPRSEGAQNKIVVSPITTLIQANVAAGASPAQAAQQVAAALNLTGVDLLSADPMTNQALYAKTVAVQELVEQIQTAVAGLGGSTSQADLTTKAFTALQAALTSSSAPNSGALTSAATISAALSATVDAVKNDLPQATQDKLANVKENLSALTSSVIANNVTKIETAITSVPAATFNNGTDSIKTATQSAIVSTKESVATQQIIEALAPVLTSAPASVAESLKEISVAVASNNSSSASTISTALDQIQTNVGTGVINVADIKDTVTKANDFYADYLKLEGFSIQSTSYTPTALNASLATPINVSSINNLLVGVSGVGKYNTTGITPITTGAALKIAVDTKEITIIADKLNLEFTAGTLTKAVIPSGAKVDVKSTLNTVASTNFTVDAEKNVLSGNKIALNTTTLSSLSPSLASQLTTFSLKDKTAALTAVISATPVFAITKADNTATLASKYTVGTVDGSGISAKFKVTQ